VLASRMPLLLTLTALLTALSAEPAPAQSTVSPVFSAGPTGGS